MSADAVSPPGMQERIDRLAVALAWVLACYPHTYRARAWAHGLRPDVEPADMARHEVANAMTAEMLS